MAVDDFSFLKGRTYGTVFINHKTHRYVDIIDTRTKDEVVERLKLFKNISIVTRDRGRSYGSAIKEALPKAIQIADIFHLDKNLTDKVQEYIKSELSSKIYLDKDYNIVESKCNAEHTIYRSKIINAMFKGLNSLSRKDIKPIKKILKQKSDLNIIIREVYKFRNITNNRDERGLKGIFKKWRKSHISLLKTYMRGIDEDLDAVTNSVKHKETNGLAEGKINKLKTTKRMLYGRASSELLKSRLFLSDYFHSIE